jgi:hypothetical protein
VPAQHQGQVVRLLVKLVPFLDPRAPEHGDGRLDVGQVLEPLNELRQDVKKAPGVPQGHVVDDELFFHTTSFTTRLSYRHMIFESRGEIKRRAERNRENDGRPAERRASRVAAGRGKGAEVSGIFEILRWAIDVDYIANPPSTFTTCPVM